MIQLSTVAKDLETALNTAALDSLLGAFHENVQYRFVVHSDEGDYVKATKVLNTLTKHINCILRINGDDKSGVTDETVSAIWQCQFEALVPDINDAIYVEGEGGAGEKIRFIDVVEGLINNTLAASTQKYLRGDDGILYYVGANYSNTIAGLVDQRNAVGESMPLAVYIDYTIVAAGLSSADIKLFVKKFNGDFERIYPTRLDISRSSVQDGNISSDADGISKVTTQGSLLQISFSKPYRHLNDFFDGNVLLRYLMAASIGSGYTYDNKFTYKLEYPLGISEDGEITSSMTYQFDMVISTATLSAETNLAASCTATLVEALDLD